MTGEEITRWQQATPEKVAEAIAFLQSLPGYRAENAATAAPASAAVAGGTGEPEPQRVITVRMPKSLHAALRDEAYARKISLNQLCNEFLKEKLR